MNVPMDWLKAYCDPKMDAGALAERLSMTGTEVERVGRQGVPSDSGFVVGAVTGVAAHPDADRLRVCTVDAGEDELRTIVCGAPNVAAGQTVPVALPGAVMPDGTELGEAKLRGVASAGMILSEAELEIGDDAGGIAVLGGGTPGQPLSELFAIGQDVLELEVTPNRPDCLGVYGVAREVHAVTGEPLAAEPWAEDAEAAGEGEIADLASVKVADPDLCPRFTARAFTDVELGPSPPWLKARLIAAGQRPINNVVDITNYVMLLTSQPLHAFDLDRIGGRELIVRRATEGEKMTTLDGVERTFDSETMLVCDREQPSGIAGIMGGQVSEVSEATTRVLMEVATWDGPNILRSSKRLALRSEASTRFEKGLHPALAMRAQRIASRLMVELCGARLLPGTIDVEGRAPEPAPITLRTARVSSLLGMEIGAASSAEYLERLGFGVEAADDDLSVTVPPDRWADVTREVDLIEEVARVHGLDEHLPATLPATPDRVGGLSRSQRLRRRITDELADLGFDEIVSWSFASREQLAQIDPAGAAAAVAVANPLSAEGETMRTTLLAGLLDAAQTNRSRGVERVALFESGRIYLPGPPPSEGGTFAGRFPGERPAPAHEPHRVAALLIGPLRLPTWGTSGAEEGLPFFQLKGVVEVLAERLHAPVAFEPTSHAWLHPGQAAQITVGDAAAGWIGSVHPRVCEAWELPGALAFELGLAELLEAAAIGLGAYEDVTSFPPVHEDIAVVVDSAVPGERVRAVVVEAGGELLRSARIFDLYEGEQVGQGRKSIALRLEFASPERTLTDEEVAERREAIREAVGTLGGSFRE